MNFADVKKFFKSWGMFPSKEGTGSLNREVIDQGINRCCHEKLMKEAKLLGGPGFVKFCNKVIIDAQDDSFYLNYSKWKEVEQVWKNG